MTRVFLTVIKPDERSALRLMLQDLELVGKTADWPTTLAQAPPARMTPVPRPRSAEPGRG